MVMGAFVLLLYNFISYRIEEQNNIGVRALSGPMHLDLNDRLSVPHILC